jgi:hypothetical protein
LPPFKKHISKIIFKDARGTCTECVQVGTHHKNDFDEVMHIVQICIGNYENHGCSMDGGSRVNIISEHFWRNLGFKKL